MVNIIRRFQHPLMVVITILVIVTFIGFFSNKTVDDRSAATSVGTLYGRPLSLNQLQRTANLFQLASALGERELIGGLLGRNIEMAMMFGQISRADVMREFAFANLIMRHEADKLGIQATKAEIDEAIQKLPAFETNGAFDSSKLKLFAGTELGPLGFNDTQIEEVVGDSIRVRKLQDLVAGIAQPSTAEIRRVYEQRFQKSEASVIRFKLADFKAAVQVSDDDVKKLFEEKKETLKTPEKRKVKAVAFTVDPELKGPARAEALQKLESIASEFAVAAGEKGADLAALAAKTQTAVEELDKATHHSHLKVQDSPEFSESDTPAELGKSPDVVAKAFTLTKEAPIGDPVPAQPDGYYVLQLAEVVPGRPRTLEEAKAELTEQLKDERSKEAMKLKATETKNKIDEALKAGKTFAEAVEAAGAKAEAFGAFSSMDRSKRTEPDAAQIVSSASELKEGALSGFVDTDTGGFLVHLDKHLPIDEADFEKQKTMLTSYLKDSQREALFQRWLDQQRKTAQLKTGKD